MDKARPIIIIKKKGGHGGHHGGAWKVAYADFVTAMMALFMVLWLLNTSKPVKEAIAGYFKDPSGTADKKGSSKSGVAESLSLAKDDMPKLKEELEKAIRKDPNLDKLKDQIEITVTSEGLRIELLESKAGTFFNVGNTAPNGDGKDLLSLLAKQLGDLPNKVSLEGHTDSQPYAGKREYGNWELSTDRANAARRLMQQQGLRADQVSQVRGFADQMLRKPNAPLDPSNRRISVIVQNLPQADDDKDAKPTAEKEEPKPTEESRPTENPSTSSRRKTGQERLRNSTNNLPS